jgi:hypothetical protein
MRSFTDSGTSWVGQTVLVILDVRTLVTSLILTIYLVVSCIWLEF